MTNHNHSTTETTSVSLLAGIREMNAASWERFVQVYGPLVYVWCRKTGMTADDASDVTQDVMAAVSTGILKFRKESASDTFRGWLRRITQNCVRDFFRQRRGKVEAVGGTEMQVRFADLPLERSEKDERAEVTMITKRALELVRTDYENVTVRAFELVVLEGMSSSDAAKQLGTSAGAVRQAKYKILRRLREELHELEALL